MLFFWHIRFSWVTRIYSHTLLINHVDKICPLHTSHTNKEGLYYILFYFVSFIYLIYYIQLWASKQYSISLITFLGVIKKRNSLIFFSWSKGRQRLSMFLSMVSSALFLYSAIILPIYQFNCSTNSRWEIITFYSVKRNNLSLIRKGKDLTLSLSLQTKEEWRQKKPPPLLFF